MVKPSRTALVAASLLVIAVGVWSWLASSGTRAGTGLSARPAEARAPESPLPRIALERLKQEPAGNAGDADAARDVFHFGRAPLPPEPPRPQSVATPAPLPVDALPATPPPAPTPPPFGVKYIGSVEQRGTKIAVLLSDDKKEVLTGREGETVANRLKIVKIGLESVDVQDVGSDRIRKIPLKGN